MKTPIKFILFVNLYFIQMNIICGWSTTQQPTRSRSPSSAQPPWPSTTSSWSYTTTTNPSTTTSYPYTTTTWPYTTTINPSTTTSYPYTTTTWPYTTTTNPSTTTSYPYTTTTWPYTTTINPSTTTSYPYTTTTWPSTTTSYPYTTTINPSTTTPYPYTTTTWPYTTTINPSTTTSYPYTTTSYPYTTTSYPFTPSFDKINILLARNVQLQSTSTPGDYSVLITCDDPSILPYVRANVTDDSTLVVSATNDCDVTIRAYIYQSIHLDSVSKLSMTAYSYKGSRLRLVSMGNSQIQISNIAYDLADFTFLGNSPVILSGNIGRLTIANRGKGTVDATRVATPNVNATLAGAGSLQVKSTGYMTLFVDGPGNLTWCSPKVQMDVTLDPYKKKNIIYQC